MSLSQILCRVTGGVLALIGLLLLAGGIWLAVSGGTLYYIIAGIGFLVSGVLAWRFDPAALWAYALVVAGSMIWAVSEVGLDWWALAPRGDVIVVMGVILGLPFVFGAMLLPRWPVLGRRGGVIALWGSIAVSVFVAVVAMFVPSNDLAGTAPAARQSAELPASVAVPDGEWHSYGRSAYGQRFSPLKDITPENVDQLEVAWSYQTGEVRDGEDPGETTYEVTPLMVGNSLYLCTPFQTVIALDATTGEEKWRFDPMLNQPPTETTQHMTCRGVSYEDAIKRTAVSEPVSATVPVAPEAGTDGAEPSTVLEGAAPEASVTPVQTASIDCGPRLFIPTSDGRLIALSAEAGEICPGFGGEDGTVDLWQNMPNVTPGAYYSTSPPVITENLIVVGGAVNDNVSTTEPSGVIRAFDLQTGELVWNWDSLNPDETAPIADGETYRENSPNSWSVSSYDPELGLIYIPMGNQPPDQFGGNRDANAEKYSASIVALNAETGAVAWVFQGVHHDLWDMDMPAQPSLIDLTINGETVPSLVVATKQGEIFVLDRRSGEPVVPVTEVAAPQGAVEGDYTAPTQPVSNLSFLPEPLTGAKMWGVSMFDQLYCRIQFHSLRYEGRYTPPSEQGTIVYPGNFGAFNWGAVAVDPERQIMFGMPVYMAFTSQLIPRENEEQRVVTEEGAPAFNENYGAPYAAKMGVFLSPLGLPCQQPPWGYVAAADLTTGETLYKHVNGTVQDLSPIPLPFKMGVPGIGGPIMTAGGVAFLSGTMDYYARAYDVTTGRQLWESRLPAGGQATPMTYRSPEDGRQYVVVVAGGHGSTGTKAGDSIIAYALPEN